MHHMAPMATIAMHRDDRSTKHSTCEFRRISIGFVCVSLAATVPFFLRFFFFFFWLNKFQGAFSSQQPENFTTLAELFSLWKCKSNFGRSSIFCSSKKMRNMGSFSPWKKQSKRSTKSDIKRCEWVIRFFMAAFNEMGVIWFRVFIVIWCSSLSSLF